MRQDRHAEVLKYIADSIANGFPPTVREICANLGIKSTSTAHRYLKELEAQGLITMGEGTNRSIRLCRSANTVNVPLLGTVTAGQPILAVESIEEYIPFYTSIAGSEDLFALHVRGESMIEAGILDGDIVIARRTPAASNGEIVVALIEDEATVKRFFKEDGHFRLQPENSTMDPIIVPEVAILGKVIALIRNME